MKHFTHLIVPRRILALTLLLGIPVSIFCWNCGVVMAHTQTSTERVTFNSPAADCGQAGVVDADGAATVLMSRGHDQVECKYFTSPTDTSGVSRNATPHVLPTGLVPASVLPDSTPAHAWTVQHAYTPDSPAVTLTGSVIKLE